MVVQESFVTRKPLEFTLIVLFILFLLLLPVYFYTKQQASNKKQEVLIAETFSEVNFLFSPDSDLSENDKRTLFRIKYEGRFVQWTGRLISCDTLDNGVYKATIDHTDDDVGDVLFTIDKDCNLLDIGSEITYKTRLIDLKSKLYIGKDGELVSFRPPLKNY